MAIRNATADAELLGRRLDKHGLPEGAGLILTRRTAERLVVSAPDGRVMVITIVGVRGNQARIAVNAPREWVVDREEVYKRRKEGLPAPEYSNGNRL